MMLSRCPDQGVCVYVHYFQSKYKHRERIYEGVLCPLGQFDLSLSPHLREHLVAVELSLTKGVCHLSDETCTT